MKNSVLSTLCLWTWEGMMLARFGFLSPCAPVTHMIYCISFWHNTCHFLFVSFDLYFFFCWIVGATDLAARSLGKKWMFLPFFCCSIGCFLMTTTTWQVSKPGSVKVEKLMNIERYSHVMHISSTVRLFFVCTWFLWYTKILYTICRYLSDNLNIHIQWI